MQRSLLTLLLPLFLCTSVRAQLPGEWFAILDAMGTELPLGIQLDEQDGAITGSLVSPGQSEARFDFTTSSFDGQRLQFTLNDLGASFSGVLDGKELRGVFNQARVDFPLTFYRYRPQGYPVSDGPVTITQRSQQPTDFPYEREAVTFPGGAAGVTLAGELTLPTKGKPRAAIILVSGSGPQDRNSYLGSQINHSPFLVLSDYLTREGYAVLRYDDRGVGESTGDHNGATTRDFGADAGAAVDYLKQRKDFRKIAIGMAGHSEGGLIAPIVAAENEDLDFVILLAAPGVPIDSLMLEQRRQVGTATGMPAQLIARDEPGLRSAYTFIKESPALDQDRYVDGLYALFEKRMDNLPTALRNSIKDPRAFNAQYVVPLSNPWLRSFLAMDPTPYLEKLTIPTLAINGLKDTQVAAESNLNGISIAMAKNGNKDATVLPLPGLNHLFQPADTGAPNEYGTIETTFDPLALEMIGNWLNERF
ncbi:alpha/beta hydrolase family protein [Neolewinella antarctica]|uniref:Serine aminopeptidase S33 domain-containing protein n=1 Tax=Neolewinella antarctica TaxID=442734 RepID=A0ABX0XH60_9BACT|nr:alpha/beta hydrolase [Neolewinella antarctica]NJC28113.1 hypothetical protein [Neolewinella antarctica]